jgi:DNA helicase-2/ATP-dependent DNA helicase PcrA
MEKLDFNDMIEKLLEKDLPKFKVIFIDEAQDLSPLQWKLFDKLKEYADDIYLAGDDDQAIFAWAGADVDRFIQEPGKEKVLKYSKRISRAVQEQSELPLEKIRGLRKEKIYYPRDFEGESFRVNNLDQLNLLEGKYLILTRTISRLVDMTKELRKRNLYYQTNKGKSFTVRLYNAIVNYNSWQRGKVLDEKESKDVEEYIGLPMKDWKSDLDWFDAFEKAKIEDRNYIKEMLNNGEDLDAEARIQLSTIHAAKGGEEDNVILCLDLGRKIKQAVKKSDSKNDEEHRVWYVGSTRARNNLYMLKAKTRRNEYKF